MKESLGSETDEFLDPLLASFDKKLKADIAGHLTNIRVAGNAEMITWGKTNAGIPIAFEGPPLQEAVDWAKTRSAKLVTQMNVESKRRIGKTISDGIRNKRGVAGIGRDIRKTFDNMSVYRGQLIARTETANALSQASLDRMKDMGIEGKEWITAGDNRVSPECMGNQGEGVIPRNQTFGGGTMAPPQHPACRCALAPALLKKREAMTPRDWKAEYKKGTPHWAEDMTPSIFAKEYVKLMKEYKVDSVLEVGCGNGRDSILFARSGLKVTSIDVVAKAVELAKANAEKAKVAIEFKVANVETLPFKDISFGAVFTLSVLHSTDLKKSLPEVSRVIKKDGIAFIYIYGDTQFENSKPKEDTIKLNDYLKTLKDLGFKVLRSYTEQEDDFDEFGEKHRIFVVTLQKET